jgi:hypothetical protein
MAVEGFKVKNMGRGLWPLVFCARASGHLVKLRFGITRDATAPAGGEALILPSWLVQLRHRPMPSHEHENKTRPPIARARAAL